MTPFDRLVRRLIWCSYNLHTYDGYNADALLGVTPPSAGAWVFPSENDFSDLPDKGSS